jgi:hypothetical protein
VGCDKSTSIAGVNLSLCQQLTELLLVGANVYLSL